ncbi:MAG TPA: glycosyltransferase family A protein [Micromonosporaceae bacterium]|jgi:glycosyltransferase involved in cell wall biosynthesis
MPGEAPLVTIGLPVRNGAATIGAVAESVLAQKYGDLEFLISDNASTDDTEAVCRDLMRADSRVRYQRNPENVGVLNNFMATMRAGRGTYFRWISDADRLEPQYVDRCLDALAADPRVILVTTGMAYLTQDGQVTSEQYTGTGLGSDDPADRVAEMLRLLTSSYRQLDPLYGMMRRERVLAIARRNMLREDEVFAVKLALAGPWAHVGEVLAMREWRAGNTNAMARLLSVPAWQARFANTLQTAELLRVVREAQVTPEQRRRMRADVYRLYVRGQRIELARRSRKLMRLALRGTRG